MSPEQNHQISPHIMGSGVLTKSLYTPKEFSHVLRRVALFSELKDNSSALDLLANMMRIRTYGDGDIIISEGELGDEFYVLIEGQVGIYKKTPDGDAYKVVILRHEITPAFGEGGLIEAEPRSATVRCDGRVHCLVLTRSDFSRFCSERPEWAIYILKKISTTLMDRLRQTSNDLMLLHKALMNEVRG